MGMVMLRRLLMLLCMVELLCELMMLDKRIQLQGGEK